ncbi:hypothetical protein L9F63_020915, partial [Diploptera punctata]
RIGNSICLFRHSENTRLIPKLSEPFKFWRFLNKLTRTFRFDTYHGFTHVIHTATYLTELKALRQQFTVQSYLYSMVKLVIPWRGFISSYIYIYIYIYRQVEL